MPIWMYNCGESTEESTDKDREEQCIVNDTTVLVSDADIDTNVDVATEADIAQNLEIDDVSIDEAMLDVISSSLIEDDHLDT